MKPRNRAEVAIIAAAEACEKWAHNASFADRTGLPSSAYCRQSAAEESATAFALARQAPPTFDQLPNLATLPTPVELRTDGFVDLTDQERASAAAGVDALKWKHIVEAAKPRPVAPSRKAKA